MPFAPKRPCAYPGCNELVAKGRCEKHEKQYNQQYDKQRGTSTERGYGAHWRRVRLQHLIDESFCRECGKKGLMVRATDVDHIIPKAKGGSDDYENLQSLCHKCHSRKTAREDGRWS